MRQNRTKIDTTKIYTCSGYRFRFTGAVWECFNFDTHNFEKQNNVAINFCDIAERFGLKELYFTENRIEYEKGKNSYIIGMCWSSDNPHILTILINDLKKDTTKKEEIDITELLEITKFEYRKNRMEITIRKDYGQKIDTSAKNISRAKYIKKVYTFNVDELSKDLILTPRDNSSFYLFTNINTEIVNIRLGNILESIGFTDSDV